MKIGVSSVIANPAVTYEHPAEYDAKFAEVNTEISHSQAVLARKAENQKVKRRSAFLNGSTIVIGSLADARCH
jgi:hypothetical protein